VQPLWVHTRLDMAHFEFLMGERLVTQTRVARAMRGVIAKKLSILEDAVRQAYSLDSL